MGERRRDIFVTRPALEAPAARRAAVRRKIIGRLLLDGGTVEQPQRASLTLALPPLGGAGHGPAKGGGR